MQHFWYIVFLELKIVWFVLWRGRVGGTDFFVVQDHLVRRHAACPGAIGGAVCLHVAAVGFVIHHGVGSYVLGIRNKWDT